MRIVQKINVDWKTFVVKKFPWLSTTMKLNGQTLFCSEKSRVVCGDGLYSNKYPKQRDGLLDPQGITPNCHFFMNYIHSETRSAKSNEWQQKVQAVQEVQPGGVVLDRLLCLQDDRNPTQADQNIPDKCSKLTPKFPLFVDKKLVIQ